MTEARQETRFDTRTDYQRAIDAVVAAAAREICIFDRDLRNTGLDSRMRSDALAAFLSRGRDRNLRIVLHETAHVSRDCPRLAGLLRHFSHRFSIRQTPDRLRSLADCFMLSDGANAVICFHADHYRGKLLLGLPEEAHNWQQRFDDLWQESVPAVSATQLGL